MGLQVGVKGGHSLSLEGWFRIPFFGIPGNHLLTFLGGYKGGLTFRDLPLELLFVILTIFECNDAEISRQPTAEYFNC